MSSSYSYSDSYSVVDVRKVMDQVHADMRMIAQSTNLWQQSEADKTMADIIRFAEEGYLDRIQIRLVGTDGKNVRVYDYNIHKNVSGWTGERAGGNLWSGFASRMAVTITFSSEWYSLSDAQKSAFKTGLNFAWGTTTDDLSVDHLSVSGQRTYASNGYGVKKAVYE